MVSFDLGMLSVMPAETLESLMGLEESAFERFLNLAKSKLVEISSATEEAFIDVLEEFLAS